MLIGRRLGRRDRAAPMSIIEHLEDLRRALITALVGWLAATLLAFVFWQRILEFLVGRAGLQGTGLVYLAPAGGFMVGLQLSFVVGLVLAAPVILWQAWWFVSPGLKEGERRLVLPLTGATSLFFLVGVAFAMFALPLFIRVLTGGLFTPPDLHYLAVAGDLLGFVLLISVAFGLVFELPVVLYTLGRLGIISSRWLYRHRAYWVIGLGLLANFMTPGVDPLTPLLVFVPLYVFWELTALLLRFSGR